MAVFFLFMAIGFFFKRINLLDDNASSILSRLEVNLFLPAMCFRTFAQGVSMTSIVEKSSLVFLSLICLGAGSVIAVVVAKLLSKDSMTRAVYIYALTIPNLGFLGYPLVEAVFGAEALLNTMIFCLSFNVYIYTAGMYMLNPKREFNIKTLASPAMIAMVLGLIYGLTGLPMPKILDSALSSASGCMAPVAMILSGFVLARRPILKMISSWKMYLCTALRLVIIPLAAWGILRACNAPSEWMIPTVGMLCMPMGLNTVVFPEAFGGDSETGAQACFISNVLGVVTIPLVFALMVM